MDYNFDIDELIAKRLAAETDAREDGLLEQWLSESDANRRYFSQMERLWQHSESGKDILPRSLDVEAALARTKARIQEKPVAGKARIVRFPFRSWSIAAALVLLIGAVWFIQSPGNPESLALAATQNILLDTLSDGSVVTLNKQSSLQASFNKSGRRIKLQGEAYFAVAPDKEKPFVIDVKKVEVTVVGTQFNVDNRSDSSKVLVSVEEGKVRVQSGQEVIYLVAGEEASVDCNSGRISRSTLPAAGNIKGWFDRRFVFDDVPLSEVVPMLEKAYNVRIELKNKALGACRLRTRLNDESIDRALELIAETFSLQIEKSNGGYILNGAACGN